VLWFSPKGRKLEGTGVMPDEAISSTLSDLQQKHDPAIAVAEKTLLQMTASDRRASNRL